MHDDDREITDEELQRLIDLNDADSAEPGGISPDRRAKLLKDTEDRIATLATIFKPGDCVLQYFEDRRAALLRGDSADEIDAMTAEYAERNDVDLDALDEDWVGATRLKLKKINRIKDEAEREAAIYALARESVLRDEQQAAIGRVPKFTHEWYAEQTRKHRRRQKKHSSPRLNDSTSNGTLTVRARLSRWFYGKGWHAAFVVVPCWLGGIIWVGERRWHRGWDEPWSWLDCVIYLIALVAPIWWSEAIFRKRHEEERRRWWGEITHRARRSGPKDTGRKDTV